MKTKYLFAVAVLAMAPLFATTGGCVTNSAPTADQRQAQKTKQSLAEADRQIGMPDITRFTERKLAKDILELRDKELPTFTYLVNMHGQLVFLGESIGYGLPYSVQFTNPEVVVVNGGIDGGRYGTLPQADPNGLFMPDGLSATWVMLIGPDGKPHPVYVESEITVSPFKLHVEVVDIEAEIKVGGE